MLICIQIVFPSLVQPLEEQEEFCFSTSHRTHANHWLTVGWTEIKKMERLVGGRDRDRKNIRVEERNPHNRNHSLRSQAGNRCEERCRESRRRLLAGLWRQYLATVLSDTWFKPEAGLQQKTSPVAPRWAKPRATPIPRTLLSLLATPSPTSQAPRDRHSRGRPTPKGGSWDRKPEMGLWGRVLRKPQAGSPGVMEPLYQQTHKWGLRRGAGWARPGRPGGSGLWRLPLWWSCVSARGCFPPLSP